MRHVALMLIAVSIASAQGWQRPGQGRAVARDNVAVEGPSADSLLHLVDEDAQQLSATDRAAVLAQAVSLAQRVDSRLAVPWTEELFSLAPQISEDRRPTLEMQAVMAVANADIEAALRFIERMDAPSKTMLDGGSDPRVPAADIVFSMYYGRRRGLRVRRDATEEDDAGQDVTPDAREKADRVKKLDRMRTIAAQLGATGVYPYAAFSAVTTAQQDPGVKEALFGELLSAFRTSPGRYADITEFTRMLMMERAGAPPAMYREALTMAVAAIDRIPPDSLPTMNFSFRGQASSGQLNNAASIQLMRLIPLIKDVDPALAEQVLAAHKDVAQTQQPQPGSVVTTFASGAGTSRPNRSPAYQVGYATGVGQAAGGDAARSYLGQITDPAVRAAASASVAAGVAQQNPQEAASFMSQASQGLSGLDDPASQLMVIAPLAQAAFETGDLRSAAAYSERGFRLGEDVVRADYDANPDKPMMSLKGVSYLSQLVTTGMRVDPTGTVSRVQGIRYPLLRANLLLTAANAAASRASFRGSPARAVDSSVNDYVRRTLNSNRAPAAPRPPQE